MVGGADLERQRGAVLVGDSRPVGGGPLDVHVEHGHGVPEIGELGRDEDGGRGLAYATLQVHYGDRLHVRHHTGVLACWQDSAPS